MVLKRINENLGCPDVDSHQLAQITIVDTCGIDSHLDNSPGTFSHLCTLYTHEKLKQAYIHSFFQAERELFISEHLSDLVHTKEAPPQKIDFFDNRRVMALFEASNG